MATSTDSDDRSLLRTARGKLALTAGPSTIWLGLLLLAPLMFMVTVSFMSINEAYNIVWQPSLDNYGQLVGPGQPWDASFWNTSFMGSLLLSYQIAIVTTVLCFTLAFPLAYLLARKGGGCSRSSSSSCFSRFSPCIWCGPTRGC
ncbi:spermidine/putrescine ABC transporter membrane protein [Halolamina pelagica]|uniref:Spermidine/putrescine ABC transporter membrane protein n=1 Tax=Halolamina pelagica TaxID=699431 RepID=A0A0P7FS01_9EURY|nr:hypothetical protein [Halolamina pelagica]KPN29365.1 spermidine/putrescine ABC transporter membrane protein [Halolamina pelagica]